MDENTTWITTNTVANWGKQTSGNFYVDNNTLQIDEHNTDALTWYVQPDMIVGSDKPSTHKENQPMETLFNVIVVSKDREILLEQKIVAMDEDEAKFQVDIHATLKEKGLKPKDVTILVHGMGEVKVRKEVQKVKVVDKEEE